MRKTTLPDLFRGIITIHIPNETPLTSLIPLINYADCQAWVHQSHKPSLVTAKLFNHRARTLTSIRTLETFRYSTQARHR